MTPDGHSWKEVSSVKARIIQSITIHPAQAHTTFHVTEVNSHSRPFSLIYTSKRQLASKKKKKNYLNSL